MADGGCLDELEAGLISFEIMYDDWMSLRPYPQAEKSRKKIALNGS